jgi:hypothetical protein
MRLLVALLVLASFCVNAQDEDSLESAGDSAVDSDGYTLTLGASGHESQAPADTSIVNVRNFDSQKLSELKNDPELQYDIQATVGESLWSRFLRWLAKLLSSLLDNATSTNWGRFFVYVVVVVSFIVIILMLLKVNAFRMFYGESGAPIPHHTLDENIHAMDFERLIQEALTANDYRLAVRLRFLFALKMLSDKNHIHWMQGKTNHDYLNELTADDLKKGFSELNYFFEYAWYGHFAINEVVYARVKQTFDEWRQRI